MTLILQEDQIEQLVAFIKGHEPVGMPTETVYGLAASIFDPLAIQKIFSMKGRPQDNPLIAHVSSIKMVDLIARDIPPIFDLLADAFWPGPITFVLPRKESVPAIVCASQETVAVRMPSHALALSLIERVGVPLVAPSANISGKPSPTSARHVVGDFNGRLSAVLDGGECQIGIESTVLSLVSSIPVLLRPGSITKEQIEAVLGFAIRLPEAGGPLLSPGMKYRHYAPKATMHLVESLPPLPSSAFILSREAVKDFEHRPLNERNFYAYLRLADELAVKEIWVLLDPVSLSQVALMNRLQKAAGISL